MSRDLPLARERSRSAPVAWRNGRPVGTDAFLADVRALAGRLPATGAAVNLCTDRYRFAVGLAAALLAGRPSLLPPDAREDTLRRLQHDHADAFVFVEPGMPHPAGLAAVVVDADGADNGEAEAVSVPQVDDHLLAATLLTSGSTGAPQPHGKTWGALHQNVAAAAQRLAECLGHPSLEGLALVATVPAQHSYGFESTVLLGLLGGAAFDSGRPFYPADIAAALASVPRPRALVTTPFHLKMLLDAGLVLPPVDLVLSATAPLSPQLAARAEAAFGGQLMEIYGCTEAGQVATRRTTAGEEWRTFGALRIAARPSDTDGLSCFVVEGGHVAEPTPLADVLELRDDRHFRLLGRSNDLVHVAGKRSSLGHLDFHLNSIPGVQDGAFWLPDDVADGVVRPVAFVVAPALQPADVIAGLRDRLEPAFVPRRVVMVPALPREATGKLTRKALAALASAQPPAASTVEPPPAATFERAIHADRPVFDGHFPGQPLLPGASLLAEVLEAVRTAPAWAAYLGLHPTLVSAKFLAPVRPGAVLDIRLEPAAAGAPAAADMVVRTGATVVARGRWQRAGASGEAAA
ncbi:AMP-binding protein [uncultured Xylophilus sp.]|uniref:AMP-binding protein n=1 Tax=uncultured Xylophilus sp. TaxID=296832 RepID=UPI0025E89672|nr:AMP-binding protein [uncultured Xylophilus sp.]